MAAPRPATRSPATPASARPIIDIQAWTAEVESTTQTLSSTHLTPPPTTPRPRGTQVRLAIPLDTSEPSNPRHVSVAPGAGAGAGADTGPEPASNPPDFATPVYNPRPQTPATHHTVNKRTTPIRRDSQKRREALLKGKEGSRARRRWENDRLLSNPHACPPLPSDWEVCPWDKREAFPYFLAPIWDAEFRARGQKSEVAGFESLERRVRAGEMGAEAQDRANVPRLVRERIKWSRGAKGLLEDLEKQVREFIAEWDGAETTEDHGQSEVGSEVDSDEEEIVFVGRDGSMTDARHRRHDLATPSTPGSATSTASDRVKREKLVFESPVEDHGASFGRWLVHSIATYYGLATWSVTTGDPARREAYVAVKAPDKVPSPVDMPRPLWGMV